jgi:hypothetical protein
MLFSGLADIFFHRPVAEGSCNTSKVTWGKIFTVHGVTP